MLGTAEILFGITQPLLQPFITLKRDFHRPFLSKGLMVLYCVSVKWSMRL